MLGSHIPTPIIFIIRVLHAYVKTDFGGPADIAAPTAPPESRRVGAVPDKPGGG